MFERFRDERQRRAVENQTDEAFERNFEVTDQDDPENAVNRAEWEMDKLRLRIQKRETDRLSEDADRLDIVIPDYVKYKRTPMGDILPNEARAELRKKIDDERDCVVAK
jgi:hypothetical protein